MPSSDISEVLVETATVQDCLKGDLQEGLSCDLGGGILEWRTLNPKLVRDILMSMASNTSSRRRLCIYIYMYMIRI